MSDLRFVEKLANAPWLCEAEYVEFMHGLLLRYVERTASGEKLDRKAIEQATGRTLDNSRMVTIRDGVARIPVEGPIFRRANLFTELSGAVSTGVLTQDFLNAYNDATVRSILFVFDSPGGEATGINELAGIIREKRDLGEKRIEAYCDGLCASAAYWLASATSKITADATAALGSIGVVTRVRNPQAAGTGTLEFWNSRSPKKRIDPKSYEGQSAIQGYVDDLGDEFIAAVASNRGVSEEEVERDFGQGFVMTGRRAVDVGLADGIGSEEEVAARLSEAGGIGYARPAATTRMEVGAVTETRDAEGVLSRIKAMLGVEPAAALDSEANEGSNVKVEERDGKTVLVSDSGENLELSAEDRDRLAGDRDAGLAEENARLKAELGEANGRIEALRAEGESFATKARESEVDRELDGFRADGVPPYMIDLARPALLASDASPEDAERWRAALSGARGGVEYGERGAADGQPAGEMTDDQKVRTEIERRGLDERADYAKVASELAAKGEIRRNTDQGGE